MLALVHVADEDAEERVRQAQREERVAAVAPAQERGQAHLDRRRGRKTEGPVNHQGPDCGQDAAEARRTHPLVGVRQRQDAVLVRVEEGGVGLQDGSVASSVFFFFFFFFL